MTTTLPQAIQMLHAIASQATDYHHDHFSEREAAIEILDNHVLEALEAQMLRDGPTAELMALHREADRLKARLEDQQTEWVRLLRQHVRDAPEPACAFQAQLRQYTAWPAPQTERQHEQLAAFLRRVLIPWPIPEPARPRERDMVGYQPTPLRTVLDLCQQADFQPDDVFYDIGAGLGHVAVLVHALTGIRTIGVEIDPAYCAYARRLTAELGLSDAQFRHCDARQADYADGSVFFLYTPFQGELLRTVLQKIRHDTRRRLIRLYTLGPCTDQVAEYPWLQCGNQPEESLDELTMFQTLPTPAHKKLDGS